MIQFNLLPDVKLRYIKTKRTKRLVVMISFLAIGTSLLLLTVMFVSVQVVQKKHLKDLSADIVKEEGKLKSVQDLDKILTIQNQLNSLPELHSKKVISSRLFDYMQTVTPAQATISSLSVDFINYTIKITGKADSIVTANKFADTLKFATFKTPTVDSGDPFNDVVTTLSTDEKAASFTLNFTYDPVLFANSEPAVISVPKIISTRSETEKPATLFQENLTNTNQGGN